MKNMDSKFVLQTIMQDKEVRNLLRRTPFPVNSPLNSDQSDGLLLFDHRKTLKTKKKGRVLLVGVLDRPESTNVHMGVAFEKLGYEVVAYNFRLSSSLLGSARLMWDDFISFIEGESYNLILFSKVDSLHPDCIEAARKAGPTWYWFMDNIEQAERFQIRRFAEMADYASATSAEVSDYLKPSNDKCIQIIEGVNTAIYHKNVLDITKDIDVVFIGSATQKRIEFIEEIQTKFKIKI